MKPFILCLIMVLLCQFGYSQYLLGLNEEEVKEQAKRLGKDDNIIFDKVYKDKKYFSLTWQDNLLECKVIVMFNVYTEKSVTTVLIPVDQIVFKTLVKRFDEDYVRLSNTTWRARFEDRTIDISSMWATMYSKYVINFKEIKPEDDN